MYSLWPLGQWPRKWAQRTLESCDTLWQHPPSPGLLQMEICRPEGT